MLALILFLALMGFSILFRVAGVLRLSIPLLYALIVPTFCHKWYYAHTGLATGILYAMLGLVAVSWVVSAIRKITG